MTVEEKIKEERKKAALEEKIAKKRIIRKKRTRNFCCLLLMVLDEFQLKTKLNQENHLKLYFLAGFGGLTAGRPQDLCKELCQDNLKDKL